MVLRNMDCSAIFLRYFDRRFCIGYNFRSVGYFTDSCDFIYDYNSVPVFNNLIKCFAYKSYRQTIMLSELYQLVFNSFFFEKVLYGTAHFVKGQRIVFLVFDNYGIILRILLDTFSQNFSYNFCRKICYTVYNRRS